MNQNEQSSVATDIAIVDSAEAKGSLADVSQGAMPDQSEAAQSEPFLTTLFNHEPRSLDRDEAESLVQLGLFSKPHIDSLRYLASLSGQKSIKEVIGSLIAKKEQEIFSDTASKISDPELAISVAKERIAKLKGEQGDELYRPNQADKNELNQRLAEEFIELQGEFSDVAQFSQLPDSVKRLAAEQSIPLKYAYALHLCREQAKINAAYGTERASASASASSFKSDPSSGTSPEMASVYKALWGNY